MSEEAVNAIRAALANLAGRYADKRINYFQVDVASVEGDQVLLTGAVLDREGYAALARDLPERFPGLCFDAADVRLLRSPTPAFASVAVNLTGLYAAPSFLAEMVSQVLNGVCLEALIRQEEWVFVRQADGYLGWVYEPYLSSTLAAAPAHLACLPESVLHEAPDAGAAIAGRLLGGTAVHVSALDDAWARIVWDVAPGGRREAWVEARALREFSAIPTGAPSRRRLIVDDAAAFIGVPYLWGGSTAYGIDCSGLAQLLHRLAGLTIPRDADMQFAAGQAVELPGQPGDLLFFHESGGRRAITHVGISLGGWRMIHSSRLRNGVYVDDLQARPDLLDRLSGARTFVEGD